MNISPVDILNFFNLLLDLLFKGTLIILITWLVTSLLKKASASLRARLWALTSVVILLLPVLSLVNLQVRFSFLPDLGVMVTGEQPLIDSSFFETKENFRQEANSLMASGYGQKVDFEVSHFPRASQADPFAWWRVAFYSILACWTGMLLSFLFCQGLGIFVSQTAGPVDSPEDLELLNQIRQGLGIRRNIVIKSSRRLKIAMTSGLIFPRVIVPEGFQEQSQENKRSILLHELAHIKRWDRLFELTGQLVRVLFFFNPLAWKALKEMRKERERAADDLVLSYGVKPSDYASQLMNVAADLGRSRRAAVLAATLSQAGSLKERLLCILNPTIRRRDENKIFLAAVILVLLLTIVPLSAFKFSRAEPAWVEKDMQHLAQNYENLEVVIDSFSSANLRVRKTATKVLSLLKPEQTGELIRLALEEKHIDERRVLFELLAMRDQDLLVNQLWKISEEDEDFKIRALARAEGVRYKDSRPSNISSFSFLGYRLLHDGYIEEAIQVYLICVKYFPENSYFYECLGEAYFYNDQLELAKENFQKALQLNPGNHLARERLEMMEE